MTGAELFRLLAESYEGTADDFRLSIGHFEKPEPTMEISVYNLPEFKALVSVTMREVRAWASDSRN